MVCDALFFIKFWGFFSFCFILFVFWWIASSCCSNQESCFHLFFFYNYFSDCWEEHKILKTFLLNYLISFIWYMLDCLTVYVSCRSQFRFWTSLSKRFEKISQILSPVKKQSRLTNIFITHWSICVWGGNHQNLRGQFMKVSSFEKETGSPYSFPYTSSKGFIILGFPSIDCAFQKCWGRFPVLTCDVFYPAPPDTHLQDLNKVIHFISVQSVWSPWVAWWICYLKLMWSVKKKKKSKNKPPT